MRYDSYQELTEVPPEEYWDFAHLIRAWIERLYPSIKKSSADMPMEDIED